MRGGRRIGRQVCGHEEADWSAIQPHFKDNGPPTTDLWTNETFLTNYDKTVG